MTKASKTLWSASSVLAWLMAAALLWGCGSSKKYTLDPVKTFDPDTAKIKQPEEKEQLQYWDRIDNTVFHQLEKPLNLNRVGRSAGMVLGIAGPREADNINVLDEVPGSSWYTYRHFYKPMSAKELAAARIPHPVPIRQACGPSFRANWKGPIPDFLLKTTRETGTSSNSTAMTILN